MLTIDRCCVIARSVFSFCSEHFKTDEHQCPTPSQSFVVPQCPLCHEPPRKWRRNEDPNLAMDAHLTADRITGKVECSAINLDGLIASKEKRPKREGECAERRCHKLMVVPIRVSREKENPRPTLGEELDAEVVRIPFLSPQCPSCSKSFCPSHRAPNQHSCSSLNLPSVDSKPAAEGSSRAAGSASALKTFPSANQSKGSPQSTSAMHTKSSALSSANPLRAISAATTKHKTEKWVPPPLFGSGSGSGTVHG